MPPKPWQARVSTPSGERARSFRSRAEAARWERAQRADLERGAWLDPRSARISVGELADLWLAGKLDVKPSTRNTCAGTLRARVGPKWGAVPVGTVSHAAVRQWVAELSAEGFSPDRVRACCVALGEVLDLRVTGFAPARFVTCPPPDLRNDSHVSTPACTEVTSVA